MHHDSPARAAAPDRANLTWEQARDRLAEDIAAGRLARGSRLPAERELCRLLGVSRVTLRKALADLVERGAVRAQHGRGWFVGPGPAAPSGSEWPRILESLTATAERLGLVVTSRVLQASVQPADIDQAERMSLAPGTPLFVLERVRLLDGLPVAVDRNQVALANAPGIVEVDFSHASLYEVLTLADNELAGSDAVVEATAADEAVARHLDLEPGRPVLVVDQMISDRRGRPLLAQTVRYRGDRYRLRSHFDRISLGTGR